jgi:Ca2+-binding EF-hand superfamily protein
MHPLLPPTQAADEDGSGELDIDEFCSRLGPHLGSNLSHQAVAQLFMKIDADAGGTVDWYVASGMRIMP